MTSHELANLLLSCEDLPVILYANGHTHNSKFDRLSHGEVVVKPHQESRLKQKATTKILHDFILIGHGSCN